MTLSPLELVFDAIDYGALQRRRILQCSFCRTIKWAFSHPNIATLVKYIGYTPIVDPLSKAAGRPLVRCTKYGVIWRRDIPYPNGIWAGLLNFKLLAEGMPSYVIFWCITLIHHFLFFLSDFAFDFLDHSRRSNDLFCSISDSLIERF